MLVEDMVAQVISNFDRVYPHISAFVQSYGWIEIGEHEMIPAFVRAYDPGGTIWEGAAEYVSLDAALSALDQALAEWMAENGFGV
jgi:hypothetical protein